MDAERWLRRNEFNICIFIIYLLLAIVVWMYSADHSTVVDRVGFALYDTVSNGIYLQVAKTIIQAKAYRTAL